jgi:hypothetical protein
MSLQAYQAALAELVAEGIDGTDRRDLSATERCRLSALAGTPGISTMGMLYRSWRLTKVLSLLPMTLKALGDEQAATLLNQFWRTRRATSLHFVAECLEFANYVRTAKPDHPDFLVDILAFESARLEMRLEQSQGAAPRARLVSFACDPTSLFEAIQSGGDVSLVPRVGAVLMGQLDAENQEHWTIRRQGRDIPVAPICPASPAGHTELSQV